MNSRKLENGTLFAGIPQDQCNLELLRFFSRRLSNRQDVRELTQEVWLRLCRVTDRHRVQEPMAYVYRTAANVLAEFRLRRKREPVVFDTEAAIFSAAHPPEVGSDLLAEQAQAQRDLLKALAELPSAYRRIVRMRLLEQKSFEDIGEAVGFSEGTTRRYYFRAIKLLWRSEWA